MTNQQYAFKLLRHEKNKEPYISFLNDSHLKNVRNYICKTNLPVRQEKFNLKIKY